MKRNLQRLLKLNPVDGGINLTSQKFFNFLEVGKQNTSPYLPVPIDLFKFLNNMMVDKSANVLDIIDKISDIDFQRDVWVEAKYFDRIINFGEAVDTLDDYNFFNDINHNIIGLTKEDLDKVLNFSNKLLSYETRAAHDMITDKNWIEITKEAQVISVILKKYNW